MAGLTITKPEIFIYSAIAFAAVVSFGVLRPTAEGDYTRPTRVDEMGSPGTEIKRTIELQSPNEDIVDAVNRSIHAQQGLCSTHVFHLTIERNRNTVTYTATIAC